jgi:hypothetical protein
VCGVLPGPRSPAELIILTGQYMPGDRERAEYFVVVYFWDTPRKIFVEESKIMISGERSEISI